MEFSFTHKFSELANALSIPQEFLRVISRGFSREEMELLLQISTDGLALPGNITPELQRLLDRRFVLNVDGKLQLADSHDFIGNYIVFYRDTIDDESSPAFEAYFSREMMQHQVKTYEQIRDYFKSAPSFWVIDCVCRVFHRSCDNPIKICMGLQEKNELEGAHRLSHDETVQIAADAEERNLVPCYMEMSNGDGWICFCCGCCCFPLEQFIKKGTHVLPGNCIESTSMEDCTACGDCIEACQFSAREIVNDSLHVDLGLCLGCGVCIDDCPSDAISLEPRNVMGI